MASQSSLPAPRAIVSSASRRKPLSAHTLPLARHALLIAAMIFFMFPIYYMVTSSFKTHVELFQQPPPLLQLSPTLDGYVDLFANRQLGLSLINSLILVCPSVCLSLIIVRLEAQPLTRSPLPIR